MANTLTGLIPILYEALDTVSREQVGFIPAVKKDVDVSKVGKDQVIRVPITPAVTLEPVTPGPAPAASGSQTVSYTDVSISKSYVAPILWNGDEQLQLLSGNKPQYETILKGQFAQAFRAIVNQIEMDLGSLYKNSSRAYGVGGTTPFGTVGELDDVSYLRKILVDNGAPTGDLQLVIDSSAAAKIGGFQSALYKVNESGSDALLRNASLGKLQGFNMYTSAGINYHTAGTAANSTVSNAGYAKGSTNLTLTAAGTGTILAGDVLVFAGDSNQYVVSTGDTDVSDGGLIVLNKPGIKVAMSAATKAITTPSSYTANMAFDRNAIVLVTRAPASPMGGDSADDVTFVTDPVSGITFEVRVYKQYRQIKIEIGLAWGYKAIKPEHMAILLG